MGQEGRPPCRSRTSIRTHTISHLSFFLPYYSLIDTLKGPGPFTVFAPTDEAFGKIDPATLNAILADKAKLTSILTYHVVSGTSQHNTILRSFFFFLSFLFLSLLFSSPSFFLLPRHTLNFPFLPPCLPPQAVYPLLRS